MVRSEVHRFLVSGERIHRGVSVQRIVRGGPHKSYVLTIGDRKKQSLMDGHMERLSSRFIH